MKNLSDLRSGDPVEVRKARLNPETGLGEEFWEPATVLNSDRPSSVCVAFADGSRQTINWHQRSLRAIERHTSSADLNIQLAALIAGVLVECETGGPYGPGCMVDGGSGPTAVRIDGLFNLVEVARKVREKMEEI